MRYGEVYDLDAHQTAARICYVEWPQVLVFSYYTLMAASPFLVFLPLPWCLLAYAGCCGITLFGLCVYGNSEHLDEDLHALFTVDYWRLEHAAAIAA